LLTDGQTDKRWQTHLPPPWSEVTTVKTLGRFHCYSITAITCSVIRTRYGDIHATIPASASLTKDVAYPVDRSSGNFGVITLICRMQGPDRTAARRTDAVGSRRRSTLRYAVVRRCVNQSKLCGGASCSLWHLPVRLRDGHSQALNDCQLVSHSFP